MADYITPKTLAAVACPALDANAPSLIARRLDEFSIDGVVVDGLLSADECVRLIGAAEASNGFSFWDPDVTAVKRSVRNADTLEFEDAALIDALYRRLLPHLTPVVTFSADDEERFEPDLEGEWVASSLNPHLLLNRYAPGGHFAPHADGSTIVDYNERSLYTVLIYLNDCAAGGATQLLSSEAGETCCEDAYGARIARAQAVVHAVRPKPGRALMYYHQVLHAGETVGKGCHKYCLRTDVMYRRVPPRGTAPHDVQAFELVLQARAAEARGAPMEALPLYRRAAKLSLEIGRAFRLRQD